MVAMSVQGCVSRWESARLLRSPEGIRNVWLTRGVEWSALLASFTSHVLVPSVYSEGEAAHFDLT